MVTPIKTPYPQLPLIHSLLKEASSLQLKEKLSEKLAGGKVALEARRLQGQVPESAGIKGLTSLRV